ncbi:MAG: tRNA (adenosine(37)-N6)-dimethylallyltransferase MiaA [Saccharofermentans sp.]|nr:tRNA (adenosine(37)-N6)-dimethylallyltransferase MiaA [Saccharofermentans sp.]
MEDIKGKIPYSFIPIIAGPTASGKSSLALEVCRKTGGVIVSSDSMQIYKGMDIGTAKDSREELSEIKHYMTDIVEPGTRFSAADYVNGSLKVISELLDQGILPVICGGTGQYISALYYGIEYGDDTDDIKEAIDRLTKEYMKDGIDKMYERLRKLDPAASEKIHPNNTRRVIRALAISESSDKTFTAKNEASMTGGARYPFKIFMIDHDRSILYDRINKRVDIMLEEGLEEEARALYDRPDIDHGSTCFQAIGYKEFKEYFEGTIDLEKVSYEIKLRSRHYAKRQLTWFRQMGADINYLKPDTSDKNADLVIEQIR